jgi:hypothetical protein
MAINPSLFETDLRRPQLEIRLSDNCSIVHMRCGGWSGDFPVYELDRWLNFYTDLRNRKNGKFAHIYGPTVQALERIKRELRERSPG